MIVNSKKLNIKMMNLTIKTIFHTFILFSTMYTSLTYSHPSSNLPLLEGWDGSSRVVRSITFENNNDKRLLFRGENIPSGAMLQISNNAEYSETYPIVEGEFSFLYYGGVSVDLAIDFEDQLTPSKETKLTLVESYDLGKQSRKNSNIKNSLSVIGPRDDRRRLVCYKGTYIYPLSLSAMAVGAGSGSSIGTENLYLTNHHVLGDTGIKFGTASFNLYHKSCDGSITELNDPLRIRVSEVLFSGHDRASNQDYDFFKLNDFDYKYSEVKSLFGGLALSRQSPKVGQAVFIPQGGLRNIIGSVNDDGSKCSLVNITNTEIYYNCDTSGGASGSPVIDDNSGEILGVHFASVGSANKGVRTDQMIKDFPEKLNKVENFTRVSPVKEKINVSYVNHSPITNTSEVMDINQPVYFENENLDIEHKENYSLIHLKKLNEITGVITTDEKFDLPIKAWIEQDLVKLPINKIIPNANNTKLFISSPIVNDRFFSRSWLPLKVFNSEGELIQHSITSITQNWFDAFSLPFDENTADILKITHNSLYGESGIDINLSDGDNVLATFYAAQGPVSSSYYDNNLFNKLPLLVKEENTGKFATAYVRVYKIGACGRTAMNTQGGGCPVPVIRAKVEYHSDDNSNILSGKYKGILPLRIIHYPDNNLVNNLEIKLDLEIPTPTPYEAIAVYSGPNQTETKTMFTSNIEDASSIGTISSFDIPTNYSVRFHTNDGRFYTKNASGNAPWSNSSQISRIEVLSHPAMVHLEAKMPQEINYIRGENVDISLKDISIPNNISLKYK
ncbi:hypothetical protein AT251_22800 [Enterovibrio nigricans]|nr:serine protease [Enterovibrio nigricans]PKF48897.1 hypothetical protein AT251_22800 [Enterovibrio nigricans]